ncbi:FAD:protein FMN transferase [Haloferula chungangensis]|uniref:FAD:protein FMN transferase n=1 Tax=Haloferula chungangensis TaxID=1048331 RepID=A0ABW2L7K7_9BACT
MNRQVYVPTRLSPSSLRGAATGHTVHHASGESMGTTWQLKYQLPEDLNADTVHSTVVGVLSRIIEQMSHWDESSELSRFNRSPANTWHTLSPEFFEVLERAVAIARDSDGACDPTLGKLVNIHGFGPQHIDQLPNFETLHRARSHAGWTRLQLDREQSRALQPGSCELDLSSIAKGYAVDLCCEKLLELGIRSLLFELGGEARGHGCKPDAQPWWVKLETPSDLPESVVALCDLSLATSGTSARSLILDGKQISHLISPHTGAPAQSTLTSVSVLAESCTDADAWATALFIAGLERGRELAETRKLAARFISHDGDQFHAYCSSELAAMAD